MATLTIFTAQENGVATVANLAAASAGGDAAVNDGRTVLVVKNADSAPHTVTVTPARASVSQDGMGALTKAAIAVAVAAGDTTVIGPFGTALFNDITGKIAITYSAVTSVTIMAVRIAKI